MGILFRTFSSQRNKLPEGRRYERPAYALAAALMTTLNNSILYSRTVRTLGLLLPCASQVSSFLATKIGPELDGFSAGTLGQVRPYFIAMLAELKGVSKEIASSMLAANPQVLLCDDATSIRKQLGLANRSRQVLGFTHQAGQYSVRSFDAFDSLPVDQLNLADNADCFLLHLACYPEVPPFLIGVLPTHQGEKGTYSVVNRAKLLLDLAQVIHSVLDFRLIGHGCDGAGQALHSYLSKYPEGDRFMLVPTPDLSSAAAKAIMAETFANKSANLDLSTLPKDDLSVLCLGSTPLLMWQDPPHQLVRLFGSLKKKGFRLGSHMLKFNTTFEPLLQRLPPLWLADHGLRPENFLDPVVDRMNVALPEKLFLDFFSTSTFQDFILQSAPSPSETEALEAFAYVAEIVRLSILPFLETEMSVLDRLKCLWRSRTRLQLLELDRELRISHLKESAAQNPTFTSACLAGVKQNAESFLALVVYVARNGLHQSFHFLPWHYGSQDCESLFRMLRYLGGSDRGMSLQDLLQRYGRLIQLQILGMAQRPAQVKRCRRYDSVTKGGYRPDSHLTLLPEEVNEAALAEVLAVVVAEELTKWRKFCSAVPWTDRSSHCYVLDCMTGHRLKSMEIIVCSVCRIRCCKDCCQISTTLWLEIKGGEKPWLCPECCRELESHREQPEPPNVIDEDLLEAELRPKSSLPDLQMIATFVSRGSAVECGNMHNRLLALLAQEGWLERGPDNDLGSLLRLRFPHLLWTETIFGPQLRRPQSLQSQSLFGGQTKYTPWKRVLSNAVAKSKESADRVRRVIHHEEKNKKRSRPAQNGPEAKRLKDDEAILKEEMLACCRVPARDCRQPMVGCDSCEGWFCFSCVGLTRAPVSKTWYCAPCAGT